MQTSLPSIPVLSPNQQSFYQEAAERCRQEVVDLNTEMTAQTRRYSEVMQILMVQKQNVLSMHAGACQILGEENVLADEPEGAPEDEGDEFQG